MESAIDMIANFAIMPNFTSASVLDDLCISGNRSNCSTMPMIVPSCLGGNAKNCTDMSMMDSLLWKFQMKRVKGYFETFVDNLNLYFIPVIIVLGLCGNTLSMLVFTCTHLLRLSSSLYLTWLSLADVGFLIALGIAWLDRIGIHWLTLPGWCQIVVYLTRVTGCLSVWLVLSFTAERYIIVYHALRKDMLCTKRRAKIVIGTLCAVALIMYTYIFKTYDVISLGPKKMCGPDPQYQDILTIMTSVDTAVACVIPSFCILLLNIKIIYKLHQFQNQTLAKKPSLSIHPNTAHKAKPIVQASISMSGSMRIKFSSHHIAVDTVIPAPVDAPAAPPHLHIVAQTEKCQRIIRYRSHLRTARMLLILASVFVLLNMPSHVFRVQAFMRQLLWDSIKTPRIQYKVHEFFEIFFFLNFAINFFVYSVCGQQFRTGLKRLILRVIYRCHKYFCSRYCCYKFFCGRFRRKFPHRGYHDRTKLPQEDLHVDEALKQKHIVH